MEMPALLRAVTSNQRDLLLRPDARRQGAWWIVCGLMLAAAGLTAGSAVAAPTDTETVAGHLQRGLQYWRKGEYARARQAFETVLRLDDLPPDLHAQANVYAEAAQAYLAGQAMLPSGYGVASIGNYHENDSIAGAGAIDDLFGGVRVGGRINSLSADNVAVSASLDYRFRRYGDAGRRDDSDLRWNINLSRAVGSANYALGARGWASYRGTGITRNDAGVFGSVRFRDGEDDQFQLGAELRRRSYPEGRLRERKRDIVEASALWTHAIADGRASFSLEVRGGLEFAAGGRPDGNSHFIGASPAINVTISNTIGAFGWGWWQHDRYAVERFGSDTGDAIAIGPRNDHLYELGAGIAWGFAPGWEISPGVLYIRDRSNIVGVNYSSTELTLSLRRDF